MEYGITPDKEMTQGQLQAGLHYWWERARLAALANVKARMDGDSSDQDSTIAEHRIAVQIAANWEISLTRHILGVK